jgi:hypothetical protein
MGARKACSRVTSSTLPCPSMFAEGTHPGPTNQRQDFGLDLDAFLRHPRKLWRWPVGRSVGAYSLGVVSAALLCWEVTLGQPATLEICHLGSEK